MTDAILTAIALFSMLAAVVSAIAAVYSANQAKNAKVHAKAELLTIPFTHVNNPITKGNDMTITGRFNTKQMTDKQLEEYLLRIRGLYVKVA